MSLVDLGKQLLDAAKNGRTDEVRTLMSNGAPFTTDWLGTSPLHFASHSGHISTAEVLLRAGISRDARTKVDRTPLHVASQEGHMEIVDLLIKNGADVEAKDMLKMTPLHWAVEKGHIHVIELLLGHGSDINCENKFDKSPVDIAFSNGRTDLAELLQLARLPHSSIVEVTPDQTVVEEVTTTELTEMTEEEVGETQIMTTPLVVSSTGIPIKTEKVDGEVICEGESIEQNSTAVLATLAALAEATGPLNAANATTTAADALNWLETQGITMISSGENQTIVNASLAEAGQTLTLTEAGKLALNFVKQQGPDELSGVNSVTEQGLTENGTRKVITIVTSQGQLTTTAADGTPVVLKLATDHESGEPPMKQIKLEEVEICESRQTVSTVENDNIVGNLAMACTNDLDIARGGEEVVELLHADAEHDLTEVMVSEVETSEC